MIERMPCHISDGPQTPEDAAELEERWNDHRDPDEAYEEMRQREIDDADPTPWCHGCGAMTKDQCDCGPIAAND